MKGRPRLPVPLCRFCNKEFKRQEHLERHIRTHTRERPYGCPCGRTFTRQDLLNRHRRLSQCSTHGSGKQAESNLAISPDGAVTTSPSISQASDENNHHSHQLQSQGNPSNLMPMEVSPHTMSSQQEMMGRFSIHDRPLGYQEQTPSHIFEPPKDPIRNSNVTPAGALDSLDFMQFESFNADMFPDEMDMINSYLGEVLPPEHSHQGFTPDTTNFFTQSFVPEPVLSPAPSSHLQPEAPGHIELSNAPKSTLPFCQKQQAQPTPVRNKVDRLLDTTEDIVATNPWAVSAAAHERLSLEFSKHRSDIPQSFTLPSRHALSRYIASWIRGYHPHLPFVHLPTTNLESMSPMLLLTLAATGSFYGFEHPQGYAMYFVAKAMINHELEERRRVSNRHILSGFPRFAALPTSSTEVYDAPTNLPADLTKFDIELLQSLLIAVMTMSWLDGPFAEEALSMSSKLTALTRDILKRLPEENANDTWEDWGRDEERRRTLLSAYFTLNIQTICFNVPPQMTATEFSFELPCSEAEFNAPDSETWNRVRRKVDPRKLNFQSCFKQLLSGEPLAKEVSATEFGNYMLIQSLLIQIYFERQVSSALLTPSPSLSESTIATYAAALGAWQSCWDSAIESAPDPSSRNSPLPFNSTAMLRLAHIHLGFGLYSQCELLSRDPIAKAQVFEPYQNPLPLRAPHLDQAVLHAIYALRIPVRVGIAFVARGRTGHWSVQHAISHFGCALLLTHWLENIYQLVLSDGTSALREEEKRLLSMVDRLVEETHLEASLGPKSDFPDRIRRLAVAAVKLWAETCKGIQVYEIVHVVGETLSLVAESLEKQI
ncbi:hypothetical protein AU210_003964 [Fusarium oxysporum f. sp. radicis-cucumerinum]|uniref:C2H2-type domain-containing protein n=3 Tax=Fusarium oxysporum TaxID=5507 RepID=A0A2H3HTM0_FUSOX|nr:hypothetical protein FOZG_04090 [Fusarium oxysporum Fo47]EWZ93644.1 hypothetical protein FOWG_06327 [Fusarium oxysporum f. sp. lycopersici MN25]PCD41409.1 hypothetical protein AU210_003964 [Fusarium oxysporum f. sp. radicis-cucumerinum]RKK25677.1 hypothetical protein BFJ65_g3584 [Fusarium oxysporum f. sp. cepae]RKK89401.1 hypothetical protein BFJ71_g12301 [Fusarium oxysporum]